jgi:Tol biopolymer transport system component
MLKVSEENGESSPIRGYNENFYRHIALSPDGSLLIYAVMEGKYLGLFIMPSAGGKSLPLAVTKDGHTEGAAWSPDGKKIAFTRTQGRNFDIWIMDINIKKIKRDLQKPVRP